MPDILLIFFTNHAIDTWLHSYLAQKVVMPGQSNLNKDFLKAFQVTDAIIQNNQPVFMFTGKALFWPF